MTHRLFLRKGSRSKGRMLADYSHLFHNRETAGEGCEARHRKRRPRAHAVGRGTADVPLPHRPGKGARRAPRSEGDGRRRRASIPSASSRSGENTGEAWACPIRGRMTHRRRCARGDRRETLRRLRGRTGRGEGPRGARRWAGRSTCTRAAIGATGRRAAWRWRRRTWTACFPCATGWRRWRSAPRHVAIPAGICYTTRSRAARSAALLEGGRAA